MIRKVKRIVALLMLMAALAAGFFLAAVYTGAFGPLQSRADLLDIQHARASLVYSEDAEIIGRFFAENRTAVKHEQLPPHLLDALIATEDARFYRHRGIDLRSLGRVLFKTILLNRTEAGGGSTITQQLAKNLFGRQGRGALGLAGGKAREFIMARRIEKVFDKDTIITLYLNTVPFGENVFGIEAAARRFFRKPAEELSAEEAALLVGMLKANTFYNPRLFPQRALGRRNVVIGRMEVMGCLTSAQADSLRSLPLALAYEGDRAENQAGYFLARVRQETHQLLDSIQHLTGTVWDLETSGLEIHTTLNLPLQQHTVRSFGEHLGRMQRILDDQYRSPAARAALKEIVTAELKRTGLDARAGEKRRQWIFDWKGPYADTLTVADSLRKALSLIHAGLLAIDPHSGAVRAYVGGIDHPTHPYDQVHARRQLASAFKPLLYAAALEEGIRPCSYFDNDSVVITDFTGYSPTNHDRSYGGMYSMAGALSHSMNIPTFHVFLQTGFAPVNDLWTRMGFSFPLSNRPSLAMGTAEASIFELTVAYAAFANGGFLVEPYLVESITGPGGELIFRREPPETKTRLVSGNTSLLIRAMLEKAVNNGTAASIRNRYGVDLPLAGKTGTSQRYADAWFAAFGSDLVMVSRAGASLPSVRFQYGGHGSGSALALPLLALSLQKLQQDHELRHRFFSSFPPLPTSLATSLECPDFREKSRLENFINRFRDTRVTFEQDSGSLPRESLFRRIFRRR